MWLIAHFILHYIWNIITGIFTFITSYSWFFFSYLTLALALALAPSLALLLSLVLSPVLSPSYMKCDKMGYYHTFKLIQLQNYIVVLHYWKFKMSHNWNLKINLKETCCGCSNFKSYAFIPSWVHSYWIQLSTHLTVKNNLLLHEKISEIYLDVIHLSI